MSQNTTVYLYFDQCSLVAKRRVVLSDVAQIAAGSPAIAQKVGGTELMVFQEMKKQKQVYSALRVLVLLQNAFPELTFTTLGETDFIIELQPKKNGRLHQTVEWAKTAVVCLIVFFGSAFTIMTFNKDASIEEVFGLIYKLSEGQERGTPGELEFAYSIGLPIGIILFFNHFLRKKLDSDPTPLQVQMRAYEKNVNTTIIENASREGREKDV